MVNFEKEIDFKFAHLDKNQQNLEIIGSSKENQEQIENVSIIKSKTNENTNKNYNFVNKMEIKKLASDLDNESIELMKKCYEDDLSLLSDTEEFNLCHQHKGFQSFLRNYYLLRKRKESSRKMRTKSKIKMKKKKSIDGQNLNDYDNDFDFDYEYIADRSVLSFLSGFLKKISCLSIE